MGRTPPLDGPPVSERDALQTRQAMRHLGVEKIIVTPEADGGWSFKGTGDLAGLVGYSPYKKGVGGSGARSPRW